jgi:cytochrome c oxidase subunit 2
MTRRPLVHALPLLVAGLLAGCAAEHAQSALHPASAEAGAISRLWWVMLALYGAVTLVTFGLLGAALLARRSPGAGPPGGDVRFVVVAGVVVPTLILVGVLVYSLQVSRTLRRPEGAFTVVVTGHQWWWDVRYPAHGLVTANELVLPVGQAVTIELRSADVVHSFWVPNLHGKMDALPGHPNRFWLRASAPGTYRGQCAEFCGVQHALMALDVVAVAPGEFERWVAARRAGPAAPVDDEVRRGRDVFFAAGCDACHAVAGTRAVARIGPDLTFVGARPTLGAGTVANTRGALAGWVSHPQTIKPGNFMPPTYLEPGDLHALVRYLEALR